MYAGQLLRYEARYQDEYAKELQAKYGTNHVDTNRIYALLRYRLDLDWHGDIDYRYVCEPRGYVEVWQPTAGFWDNANDDATVFAYCKLERRVRVHSAASGHLPGRKRLALQRLKGITNTNLRRMKLETHTA